MKFKNLSKKLISIVSAMAITCSMLTVSASAAISGKYEKISGATRYETAHLVSQKVITAYGGTKKVSNIIVANGDNFPDALSASYLSMKYKAPIIYSRVNNDKTVDKTTDNNALAFIKKYISKGGTVYLLGGTGSISQNLQNIISNAGYSTNRLGGKTRYDTNLSILKLTSANRADEIMICSGTNFADALSVSANKKPIMLVGTKLTSEQISYLKTTNKKFTIVGGNGAISADVEAALKKIGSVTRIQGKNRYITCANAAKKYFPDTTKRLVVSGTSFPDALCGTSLAIATGSCVLLASKNDFTNANYSGVKAFTNPSMSYYIGGGIIKDLGIK